MNPTEQELWENGCLTRWQMANWADSDFAAHAAGIRKTLQFLFDRMDEQHIGTAPNARIDP